ncbi:hypothetical protein C9J85_04500 [Haloferax sp. wsp5]|nr:hypothetical protein C9J85_04500 [Haloferax sp. wsp5]
MTRKVHRALERDLAASRGTERALVFSSGYAANIGTIDALAPDVVLGRDETRVSYGRLSRRGQREVVYDTVPGRLASDTATRAADVDEDEQLDVVPTPSFSIDETRAVGRR